MDRGVGVEVVDVRSLVPLDLPTLLASVAKTKNAVVVHEAVTRGGFGAELSARIHEELFSDLERPVQRVGAANTPVPFAKNLEAAFVPQQADIEDSRPGHLLGIATDPSGAACPRRAVPFVSAHVTCDGVRSTGRGQAPSWRWRALQLGPARTSRSGEARAGTALRATSAPARPSVVDRHLQAARAAGRHPARRNCRVRPGRAGIRRRMAAGVLEASAAHGACASPGTRVMRVTVLPVGLLNLGRIGRRRRAGCRRPPRA